MFMIFEPLEAILFHFDCHLVSILDARTTKNEAQNASPFSTGQNPEVADGYTLFNIFMLSKASQKDNKMDTKSFAN